MWRMDRLSDRSFDHPFQVVADHFISLRSIGPNDRLGSKVVVHEWPLPAISGHSPIPHRSQITALHSITRSARRRIDGGILRPSAFAVLRLIASSNFVGRSTGSAAGLSPLRILSTYIAARPYLDS